MEQKMITIPFDVELAKKIQAGKHPGKIAMVKDEYEVKITHWNIKNAYPIIAILTDSKGYEYVQSYTNCGNKYDDGDISSLDLVLQVPEWTQFKDGDVLSKNGDVFIFNKYDESESTCYHYFGTTRMCPVDGFDVEGYAELKEYSYATEEEKQQLIDALKASTDPLSKEYLKRFFGIEEAEKKTESEVKSEIKSEVKDKFEPFQKVLVRSSRNEKWSCNLFSIYNKESVWPFICAGGRHKYCIPYNDQTKHLLGTIDNWEE